MIKYSTPGIYIEESSKQIEPIRLYISGLTGFIGITQKGPLNKGIRIKNFRQFLDIFGGFVTYGNLAYAVFGFFNAGGKDCIIVRTAHLGNKEDPLEAGNCVSSATMDLSVEGKEPSIECEAFSPGTWGNRINLKLWYNAITSTPLVQETGKDSVEVVSPEDMEVGDYIRIQGASHSEYHCIRMIKKNTLYFHTPLEHKYSPDKEQCYCEGLRISVIINYEKENEEYLYLSLNSRDSNYYLDEINTKSRLLKIRKKGMTLPREIYYEYLSSGKNGVMGITPADFIGRYNGFDNNTGLGIFEAFEDVSLLVAPDLAVFQDLVYKNKDKETALADIFAVQKAMVDQCEKLGNRFAILDAPETKDVLEVVRYAARFDTAHAALYYPRIHILNPEDISGLSTICIPPSGHVAGEYVKCDLIDGIYHAPANKQLQGAVGMNHEIEHGLYDVMYGQGINGLRYFPGRGVKIWGARTLSSDPDWRYINVRRTFCAIRDALKQGTGWAIFEPNDQKLRKRLVRHVTAFMLFLWREGYMKGTVPEEGFYVRCDAELNPKENIDVGIITVEVGIAIAKPAEFLVVKVVADTENSMVSLED